MHLASEPALCSVEELWVVGSVRFPTCVFATTGLERPEGLLHRACATPEPEPGWERLSSEISGESDAPEPEGPAAWTVKSDANATETELLSWISWSKAASARLPFLGRIHAGPLHF